MADLELDIAPRLIGRVAKAVQVEFMRELTEADIALLGTERHTQPNPIGRIRERHHALARCLASGMGNAEASAVTGYDPSRISILSRDPTFQELVAHYKGTVDAAMEDFVTRAAILNVTAINEIQNRLEEEPETFTLGDLRETVKLVADRTGHAPVQRSLNVNVNAELGSRLSAARQRRAKLTLEAGGGELEPIIEGEVLARIES